MGDPTIFLVKTSELLDEPAADDNVSMVLLSDYKPLQWLCEQQKNRIGTLETRFNMLARWWINMVNEDFPGEITAYQIEALEYELDESIAKDKGQ